MRRGSSAVAVAAAGLVLLMLMEDPVARVAGGLLVVLGVMIWRSRRDPGAWWRWDHFLPFLTKRHRRPGRESLIVRGARRALPGEWFFDPRTGREGKLRRWCRRVGPTVVAAPIRRMVQAGCFLLFVLLFFYVCWPYGARPEEPGALMGGWEVAGMDQASGRVTLEMPGAGSGVPGWVTEGKRLYVSQEAVRALVEVSEVDGKTVRVVPEDPRLFLLAGGQWTISEKEPGAWPSHYADHLQARERVPADFFLSIDPLVSLSTAVAARSWVWSLTCAAIILLVCVFIPRGFCGYLCPLGSLIDLFDWAVSKRVKRWRISGSGWWVHLKYYLLAAVMVAAVGGVLLSGFVAAIPVITRGFLFLGEPVQTGVMRGWHLVPPMNAGHLVSIGLFLGVLALGLLQPRFWCRYVCPSGAVFSLGNFFRASERKVESSCIHCKKCITVCPFDAIKPDFTTRTSDCTLCQTCGGVCPTHAIKFVDRWDTRALKAENDPPTGETSIGRRGFVSWAAGLGVAAVGGGVATWATRSWGAAGGGEEKFLPVRPPGSVPEDAFLQMCIRCGECFKACPNNVLQPLGFEQGLEGLWTPAVKADWAGCASSCNACGQVCPTGAIRALPMEEKKEARMGLAMVRESTCLPFAGREACQLCVDECVAAGYEAIEFTRVHTEVDAEGRPVEGSGYVAPVVIADKCVGCGLCQTRCYGINVEQKGLLQGSAIVIEAGEGKEDRLFDGPYRRDQAGQSPGPAAGPADPVRVPAGGADPAAGPADDPFAAPVEDPFGL